MDTSNPQHPYDPAFLSAVSFVLAMEGGLSSDPVDPGGDTRFGISKQAYPDIDINHLTESQAKALYYRDYWQPCRCGEMPVAMATAVFDTAVNMGKNTAIRLLQQSLGVPVDSMIGPVTLAACNQQTPGLLLSDFLSRRALRYHRIAREQGNDLFVRGWLRRTYALQYHLFEERLL